MKLSAQIKEYLKQSPASSEQIENMVHTMTNDGAAAYTIAEQCAMMIEDETDQDVSTAGMLIVVQMIQRGEF